MAVLDQVMRLKGQGMTDQEVVGNLQQQGISPKEINDALDQARIKNAVTDYTGEGAPIASAEAEEGLYTPQTQEAGPEYAAATSTQPEYYEEGAYGGAPSAGADSDTMIEIANQVFSEKIKKIQNQIEDISELKTLAQVKVANVDERLKRIEKMIDTLQIKVLEKVGSFGSELSSTKKEVSMLEDSLRKTIRGRTSKTNKVKKGSKKKK